MKDALGHGSNAHGGAAHQSGVDAATKPMMVKLSSLHPSKANLAWNAKYEKIDNEFGKQTGVDMYRARIRAGETLNPIVIRLDNSIVDGHTRYVAYKREGVKEAPAMYVNDSGYPINKKGELV